MDSKTQQNTRRKSRSHLNVSVECSLLRPRLDVRITAPSPPSRRHTRLSSPTRDRDTSRLVGWYCISPTSGLTKRPQHKLRWRVRRLFTFRSTEGETTGPDNDLVDEGSTRTSTLKYVLSLKRTVANRKLRLDYPTLRHYRRYKAPPLLSEDTPMSRFKVNPEVLKVCRGDFNPIPSPSHLKFRVKPLLRFN